MLHASDILSSSSRTKASLSPSLAFPIKEDYWPLLAVKLIFAGTLYALMFGLALLGYALFTEWQNQELLYMILMWASLLFFGPCVFGGWIALICVFLLPIAGWFATRVDVIRPGRLMGGLVATVAFVPLWILTAGQEGLRVLPVLLLYTLPCVLWLQATGSLAAPGDVMRSACKNPQRTTIGQLLIVVTAASIAAAVGSISQAGLGLVLLLTTFTTLHWLGRWPIEKTTKWILSRRFARRRNRRLAARST